ncbi:hypothetical protein C9374_003633 [Naegleria lovaniensis]|uniref:EF-hand domain-containing protein n=1 Tax=Naegleria lovaniensis TaxID=51637 RepID=A0AA88H087_NAELO|nr:uncharacterized protein C9374_003633 [Naegleria lovaniensis]KAG2393869.1 hypothetical protein C9374_003633 [Naegleria lovaniensis]
MEKVNSILHKYPDAIEVSLDHCGLRTLDEVLVDLSKLKYLKVLRLSNNNLRTLPSDMSGLQKVEYLDLRNNLFESAQSVLAGLFSLPNLKHLYITLDEKEEDEIIISLSNLESFNGTPLTDLPDVDPPLYFTMAEGKREPSSVVVEQPNENQSMNQGEPQTEDSVLPLQKESPAKPNATSSNTAATHTGEVLSVVDSSNDDLKDLKRLHDSIGLYLGQRTPFDASTTPILKQLNRSKETPQEALTYQIELLNCKRQLFDVYFEEVIDKISEVDKKASSILMIVKNSYSDMCESYYSMIKTFSTDCFSKLATLQKDLDSADKDIANLLEETESLQQVASKSEEAKAKLIRQHEVEREQLSEEIGVLKLEIEKYKNRLAQVQINRQRLSMQVSQTPQQILSQSMVKPKDSKQVKLKPLSLKQLKEIIEEIYTSKHKFDQKCQESKLPRETMEQHLYTFLNQKYGLKTLIFEWATAINFGVKRFSREDNEVKVFGKILKNEIDEEFRYVQKQLKDTTAELLKVFLRGKYSKKVDHEIHQIIQNRLNGDLNEDEWVDIIKYMYNKEDSLTVIIRVNDAILEHQKLQMTLGSPTMNKSFEKATRVPYKTFLEVLLDFQLESHEKFLSKFVKMFREVDSNKDGILNQHELKQLLTTINPNGTDEEYQNFVSIIDPNNNQQITFSECVTYLSADLLKLASESSMIVMSTTASANHNNKSQQLGASSLSINDL